MIRARLLVPAIATTMFATGAAIAQSRHNTNAPIDFAAEHFEIQDRANRAIMSGGVSIKQAAMTLDAARVTVNYTGQVIDGSPQVSRLDASGGVVVTRPDQTARSQYAVYDLNTRVISMLGNVQLTQGGNTIGGGRLRIDLDTGKAVIDGAAVGSARDGEGGTTTQQNGRVTGRFSVPDRDN